MTATVKKIGKTVALLIPRTLANELELTEGATLDISADESGIHLRKPGRPRRRIADIVAQIKPETYRKHHRELLDDGPVGKEHW